MRKERGKEVVKLGVSGVLDWNLRKSVC
jgi:hypothetical protein